MEDFVGRLPDRLRDLCAQVAPGPTHGARAAPTAVAPQPARVSTCFLVDDYFGRFGSPAEVVPMLVERGRATAGLTIDYLARESACAHAGGVAAGRAGARAALVADPPPGSDRRPADRHGQSGWLCNGVRRPGRRSAEAMRWPRHVAAAGRERGQPALDLHGRGAVGRSGRRAPVVVPVPGRGLAAAAARAAADARAQPVVEPRAVDRPTLARRLGRPAAGRPARPAGRVRSPRTAPSPCWPAGSCRSSTRSGRSWARSRSTHAVAAQVRRPGGRRGALSCRARSSTGSSTRSPGTPGA